jgi:hypothetical protein
MIEYYKELFTIQKCDYGFSNVKLRSSELLSNELACIEDLYTV